MGKKSWNRIQIRKLICAGERSEHNRRCNPEDLREDTRKQHVRNRGHVAVARGVQKQVTKIFEWPLEMMQ